MDTITFFANKGGSGRTVSTMALASGFLAQGKRVAVMDCSDLAWCQVSPLRAWTKRMTRCGFCGQQLSLLECETSDEVEDAVAVAHATGIDILLIDTSARIYEPQAVALGMADMIVAPAIGPFESKRIVAGISEYPQASETVFGLVIDYQNRASQAAKTRKGFGYHSVLKSELPWAEALSEQILHGDIPQLVSRLARRPGESGFARYREAQAALVSVQRLAFEVDWALKGHRLEPTTIGQSRNIDNVLAVV
ncbi:division plane positioning ATPase MipZ [Roseobacter cerasinus]|nr:division plane positioning ATPase MipZ [Roseobacter cerasinus]